MTDQPDYPPAQVHLTSISDNAASLMAAAAAGRHRRKLHTKLSTVKLKAGGTDSPQPLLPRDDQRVVAYITTHTGGAADTHSSNGWISTLKSEAAAGGGFYVACSDTPPLEFHGSEALFAAADAGSTTDLWFSIAVTSEAE